MKKRIKISESQLHNAIREALTEEIGGRPLSYEETVVALLNGQTLRCANCGSDELIGETVMNLGKGRIVDITRLNFRKILCTNCKAQGQLTYSHD